MSAHLEKASPPSASICPPTRRNALAFARLLIKWNKVYNLTAIRDEAQVSPTTCSIPCRCCRTGRHHRLVDVGSGGGLPGVVLAICRPDLQVDSVETVQKKATFQNQAKIELKLANFRAHHARIENWQPAYAPGPRTASSPAPSPTWPTSSTSPPTWPAPTPASSP
jgi:16S rRNA (guanine527-N7)-methyltransferase